jgi:hypothetical protein
MAVSKQLAALLRTGALFAALWWVVSTVVSVIVGGPLIGSALTYGAMFGLLGGISGVTTALLVAKGTSSASPSQINPWRFAAFGFLGGCLPILGITALGLVSGASASAITLMLGLGFGGGVFGGVVAAGAAAAAKRLPANDADRPELPVP